MPDRRRAGALPARPGPPRSALAALAPALAALAVAALALAACGRPVENGRRLEPKTRAPGSPPPALTAEAAPATTAPLGTLPVLPTAAPSATHDPRTPTPDDVAFSRLVYTYTAGIRPARIVLTLEPGGAARMRFGTQQRAGTLDAATLAEIRAALATTDFFALEDHYVPTRDCCDLPTHDVTLTTADGRSKNVYVVGAVPDELRPLIDALSGIWRQLPVVTP
jgi:hypothetical protein